MRTSDDDSLVLVLIGAAALMAVLASAGLLWARASAWLVEHKVVVPSGAHPVVSLPGGVGLDLPRLLVVAAVLTALAAVGVSAVVRRVAARSGDA